MSDDAQAPDAATLDAAEDLTQAVIAWLQYLISERRASEKTVEAYLRDVTQFSNFLRTHLGGEPSLKDLSDLRAADFRAFLAMRRQDGVSSRTLARALSSIRSLFRFMEKKGLAENAALSALRSPKIPHAVPKALGVAAAKKLVTTAPIQGSTEAETWVETRDSAVLLLLYGCGLRISEALGLDRKDAPLDLRRDTMTITGKGNKTRIVPVLPVARQAIEEYLDLCPYVLEDDDPLVRRRQGRPAQRPQHPASDPAPARLSGTAGERDAARPAPQLRNAPPVRRRRSPSDPGAARPCQPVDHPGLHRSRPRPPHAPVHGRSPQGVAAPPPALPPSFPPPISSFPRRRESSRTCKSCGARTCARPCREVMMFDKLSAVAGFPPARE